MGEVPPIQVLELGGETTSLDTPNSPDNCSTPSAPRVCAISGAQRSQANLEEERVPELVPAIG